MADPHLSPREKAVTCSCTCVSHQQNAARIAALTADVKDSQRIISDFVDEVASRQDKEAELEARIAELEARTDAGPRPRTPPVCAICGKPAVCFGAYDMAEQSSYACGQCCGHGNEDGQCQPIVDPAHSWESEAAAIFEETALVVHDHKCISIIVEGLRRVEALFHSHAETIRQLQNENEALRARVGPPVPCVGNGDLPRSDNEGQSS